MEDPFAKAAKGVLQWDGMKAWALEQYDFHMAAVRRGKDPDLLRLHLAAAQRHYDDAVRFGDIANEILDRAILRALGL